MTHHFGLVIVRERGLQLKTVFSTGLISEVELGAQSVIYQLANVAYMVLFPSSFLLNIHPN